MNRYPSTPARSPARRSAPQENLGRPARLCLLAALEALFLPLLAALLGRPRHPRAWHLAPIPLPAEPPLCRLAPAAPFGARTASDGTHLACESPILYVLGPGPNPGLRPRPRATPITRAPIARAPPRASAGP